MKYVKVVNHNRCMPDFGKKYTFTSVFDYIRWDRGGFEEIAKEQGVSVILTDANIKAVAERVEGQLPVGFYADSKRATFNFSTSTDDFNLLYLLIVDTIVALFG